LAARLNDSNVITYVEYCIEDTVVDTVEILLLVRRVARLAGWLPTSNYHSDKTSEVDYITDG